MERALSSSVRPLSRYRRDSEVESAIDSLAREDSSEAWQRIESGAVELRPEVVLWFLRHRLTSGDKAGAWRIAERLAAMTDRTVTNALVRSYGLTRDEREEISEQLSVTFYTQWLSLEPEQEFWEVRFALVLKRRLIDAVKRRRAVRDFERPFSAEGEMYGSGSILIEQVQDDSAA